MKTGGNKRDLDRIRFGVLCVLGYVALSWAVRFDMELGMQMASLIYPLDTFSMYAEMPGENPSILLVRSRDGRTHSVTSFRSFACDAPITGEGARCADRRGIRYHFDDFARHVQHHAGPGEIDVDLITRTWTIQPGEPLTTSDCVIAHCKVSK